MKSSQYVRTRRQLLRVTTVSAASIPFLALARKPASAQIVSRPAPAPAPTPTVPPRPTPNSCFLKGTKIWTPSGDRPVQELQIGDEVQTLAGRKAIKWIGYNKFTKEEGRAWQEAVKPIRGGPGCLNRFSASISGASAGVRLPSGAPGQAVQILRVTRPRHQWSSRPGHGRQRRCVHVHAR
jgi:hypothetical protein